MDSVINRTTNRTSDKAKEQDIVDNTQQVLRDYIQQHGKHCMAYSSLQKDLEYEVMEGVGFIAYKSFKHFFWSRKGTKVVLADPVCDEKNNERLVTHFIKKYSNVVFLQASDTLAKLLDSMGYEVNQFGIETELDIQNYTFKGKHRSKLRQWRNKCEREQVVVKEGLFESNDLSTIKELSAAWVKRKGGHELTMLTRPLCLQAEPDVRYFSAYQDNNLIGFSVFDPIYSKGKVTGYYHNIDRLDQQAPHGTGAYMLLQAMDIFKAEGKQLISLGMSPLYSIKRTQYRYNNFLHEALFFTFKNLGFIYPFKGNAGHKKKFHGSTKPVFFSSIKGNSLWQLLVALKAIDLF